MISFNFKIIASLKQQAIQLGLPEFVRQLTAHSPLRSYRLSGYIQILRMRMGKAYFTCLYWGWGLRISIFFKHHIAMHLPLLVTLLNAYNIFGIPLQFRISFLRCWLSAAIFPKHHKAYSTIAICLWFSSCKAVATKPF